MYLDKLTGQWKSGNICYLCVTIPTSTAILGAGAATAVGGVVASSIGSGAAKSAAQTEASAADKAAQEQIDAAQQAAAVQAQAAQQAAGIETEAGQAAETQQLGALDTTKANLQPFITAGQGALGEENNLLGLSPDGSVPSGGLNTAGIQPALAATPGYQFTLDQGLKATQNSYAAQGLGSSGAALKGAATFATGLADQTYEQRLQDYLQLANTGQSAATNLGGLTVQNTQIAGNYGLGAAEAAGAGITGAGQAQATGINTAANAGAAGQIGAANATAAGTVGSANALTSGIGNATNALSSTALLTALTGNGGFNSASITGSGAPGGTTNPFGFGVGGTVGNQNAENIVAFPGAS